jgi:hypothetical protein
MWTMSDLRAGRGTAWLANTVSEGPVEKTMAPCRLSAGDGAWRESSGPVDPVCLRLGRSTVAEYVDGVRNVLR